MKKNPTTDSSQLDNIAGEEIGKKIKNLSEKQGISQDQLAELLGKDTNIISDYYCGKSLPDERDLIILCRILGVSSDELFVLNGDIEGYQPLADYTINHEWSEKDSKVFNPSSKRHPHIHNLDKVSFCLTSFTLESEQEIRNKIMDELLSGKAPNSSYMQNIYEVYIWNALSEEQKAICKEHFVYLRSENRI